MKKIALVTAFVLSQVLAVSAFAQTSRAEVKAETASAVKSGKTTEGQASPAQAKGAKVDSTAVRADVKKETAAANKAGAIVDGQAAPAQAKGAAVTSTKARADVKSDTKAAVKAGDIATGQATKP